MREVAERRIHDAATVCAAKAAAAEQAALRTEEFAREQIAHIQEQARLQVESLQLVLAQREREQGERASERVEMEEQQAAARERAHHVSLETQKAGLLAQEKIVQVTLVARKAEEDADLRWETQVGAAIAHVLWLGARRVHWTWDQPGDWVLRDADWKGRLRSQGNVSSAWFPWCRWGGRTRRESCVNWGGSGDSTWGWESEYRFQLQCRW